MLVACLQWENQEGMGREEISKGSTGIKGKWNCFHEKCLISHVCCIDCMYLYYNAEFLCICAHKCSTEGSRLLGVWHACNIRVSRRWPGFVEFAEIQFNLRHISSI